MAAGLSDHVFSLEEIGLLLLLQLIPDGEENSFWRATVLPMRPP
jgi:hypothetical protein